MHSLRGCDSLRCLFQFGQAHEALLHLQSKLTGKMDRLLRPEAQEEDGRGAGSDQDEDSQLSALLQFFSSLPPVLF